MTLETVRKLTETQVRGWCLLLASLHSATAPLGRVAPLSLPACPRGAGLVGCGTCYRCQEEIVMKLLLLCDVETSVRPVAAHLINDAVYEYVTRLDERLGDALNDDYVPMAGPQYARVLHWAATLVPHAAHSSRHAAVPANPFAGLELPEALTAAAVADQAHGRAVAAANAAEDAYGAYMVAADDADRAAVLGAARSRAPRDVDGCVLPISEESAVALALPGYDFDPIRGW